MDIAAAAILWEHWQGATQIDELPASCRPRTRTEGYAVQAQTARLSGQSVVGWKIAATSVAGQKHINVDGPLAGRLLSATQRRDGDAIALAGNVMRVAEAEFAFRMADALPRRSAPYTVADVMVAVGSLHPAIEVPDSRYRDFVHAGAPQLIADMACACWFVLGDSAPPEWRQVDLAKHRVLAYRNEAAAGHGSGANVLGDPWIALAWLANELCAIGTGLAAGDVVMTGTCLVPVAVLQGDSVRMDFGPLGEVAASFSP